MTPDLLINPTHIAPGIRLETHLTARQKACAAVSLQAGAIVLTVDTLMAAVSAEEKGHRCDFCLCKPSKGARLLRCSGCASFWYCGEACQKIQWREHHRNLCKTSHQFVTSVQYQALSPMERVDAILLSQLLAFIFPNDDFNIPVAGMSGPVPIFFDLLQRRGDASLRAPPLCRSSRSAPVPPGAVESIYARFGNNNFLIHSHLTPCAHGIFPLASRLFNHSCMPNCVVKYVFSPGNPVRMQIVAIQDIAPEEEITLPYLDPALPLKTRQDALRSNYGFCCTCALCKYQTSISPLPSMPPDPQGVSGLEQKMCDIVSRSVLPLFPPLDRSVAVVKSGTLRFNLPKELHALFTADYLPSLSEKFSRSSHEGEFGEALECGRTLLALYAAIYPLNYPQIGMHALELAKTAWNAVITFEQLHDSRQHADIPDVESLRAAHHYLNIAAGVLNTLGPEGDTGGPLEELAIMRSLLRENPTEFDGQAKENLR